MATRTTILSFVAVMVVMGASASADTKPEYCAAGGPRLWANLDACGWPGPRHTGYRAGTVLTATKGRTVTTDNTVIDGERISGRLIIRATNVTIRNSFVSWDGGGTSGRGVIVIAPGASATVDHVEIDGLNHTHACIWHEGVWATVSAVNCHGVNDGVFAWASSSTAGDNLTVRDSYFHGFTTNAANGHIDGIQTEGTSHSRIIHNTFDMPAHATSAVAIWNELRSSTDWTVANNLFTGGGFTLYAEDYSGPRNTSAKENVADSAIGGHAVTNVRFLDNRFSTSQYPHGAANHSRCVGIWGTWFFRGRWPPYFGGPTDLWNVGGSLRSGNVVLETGQNIDRGGPQGCEGANTSPAALISPITPPAAAPPGSR
jgi:hypothetical protein